MRMSPRIPRPFLIRSVEVIPVSGISAGQYVDVLVAESEWSGDLVTAPGSSIFEAAAGAGQLPVVDVERALPVTAEAYDVPIAAMVLESDRVVAVQTRFVAPAVALPACHVVVVIEEMEAAVPPIEVRPPVIPPPPPVPPPPVDWVPPPVPGPGPPPPDAGPQALTCYALPRSYSRRFQRGGASVCWESAALLPAGSSWGWTCGRALPAGCASFTRGPADVALREQLAGQAARLPA